MKALILCCGGSPEPLEFCIENFQTDFYYFLHSNKSVDIANELVKKYDIQPDKYSFKLVENHESLEDSFAKSREMIEELKKNYDEINIDFTGGTKPMVSGLVLAAIGENCTYTYVGAKDSESRDKFGMGIVKDGFEVLKNQRDPYDVFAVMEFERGMEFFNRYQFEAARTNFKDASNKLESESLKELSQLYLEIVDVYDLWDKFKNVEGEKHTLNYVLKQILDKIESSDNLKRHFNENYPDFIAQMEDNIEFLNLKLSRKGMIKPHNVEYYLPDLLYNAYRRIEEGKYDDAVARLYRSIELIAQMSLTKENVINEQNLWSNSEFSINIRDVDAKQNGKVDEILETFHEYNRAKEYGNKTFRIALKNSYELLDAFDLQFASDYLNDDEINRNITSRNRSILAHGLQPIEKDKALELYRQVLKYAKRAFPEIVEYMDMSEFPKFKR